MRKLSKRYKKDHTNIKNIDCLNLSEAIKLLKNNSTVKFVESVEFHANLNINSKHAKKQLQVGITMPNNIKREKQLRIAVLTNDKNLDQLKLAGADAVGNEQLIENIVQNSLDFDLLLTTHAFMPKLLPYNLILTSKKLMPSIKTGTISKNLLETLIKFKKGLVEYRVDKNGNIHVNCGKINFTERQLIENIITVYKSIEKAKPADLKGKFFKSSFICTSMSPSIKLNFDFFN